MSGGSRDAKVISDGNRGIVNILEIIAKKGETGSGGGRNGGCGCRYGDGGGRGGENVYCLHREGVVGRTPAVR